MRKEQLMESDGSFLHAYDRKALNHVTEKEEDEGHANMRTTIPGAWHPEVCWRLMSHTESVLGEFFLSFPFDCCLR